MRSSRSVLIGLVGASLIGCGFSVASARAGYTVTLVQQGPNVVATGSGAIDLTNLLFAYTGNSGVSQIIPLLGLIVTGPAAPNSFDDYVGVENGPGNFGSGGANFGDSGSGDIVGTRHGEIVVPHGYISGAPLSDGSTYDNQTFSSLGVTPGTYEWSWGNGSDQNFTLIAVPEPRVGLLLGAALLLLLGVRLRQLRFGPGAA
jgi:hypothetical protein